MHYGASSRKSKTKMSWILRRVSRNKEVFYPNIVNLSLHDRFVMNLMLVDANTIKNLGIYFTTGNFGSSNAVLTSNIDTDAADNAKTTCC